MKIAIHQPNFLPWLGFFHKMDNVDAFILLDDVQISTGPSYANRCFIKNSNGLCHITVPIHGKNSTTSYQNAEVFTSTWAKKAAKTIDLGYKKAPFYEQNKQDFIDYFQNISLLKLNMALISNLRLYWGIETPMILASDMKINPNLFGTNKILEICKLMKADTYLSGAGAGSKRYVNENTFAKQNIKCEWQTYTPEIYAQQHWTAHGFIPNLSAIDYLFNKGTELPWNRLKK